MSKKYTGPICPSFANQLSENLHFRSMGSQPCNSNEEFALLSVRTLSQSYSCLEGKILTILESAIVNEKQLEALKSIVRNEIWANNSDLYACLLTVEQVNKIS